MTLKEKYWKDGYVFQFREGEMRMVWGDRLISEHGYISTHKMSDDLVNVDHVRRDAVVAVYEPNCSAGWLGNLVRCNYPPVWRRSEYMMTLEDIKEKLGIPKEEGLIIIKRSK